MTDIIANILTATVFILVLIVWPYRRITRNKRNFSNVVFEPDIIHESLRGAQHQGLRDSDLGESIGEIRCEKGNPHDKYAIAVYNSEGKQVGYLPGGNKSLYLTLKYNFGGKMMARVFIGYSDHIYGAVDIPVGFDTSDLTIDNWDEYSRKHKRLT